MPSLSLSHACLEDQTEVIVHMRILYVVYLEHFNHCRTGGIYGDPNLQERFQWLILLERLLVQS